VTISSCYRDALDKPQSIDGEDEIARPDGWIVLRLVGVGRLVIVGR
jgi:hypothetical protein